MPALNEPSQKTRVRQPFCQLLCVITKSSISMCARTGKKPHPAPVGMSVRIWERHTQCRQVLFATRHCVSPCCWFLCASFAPVADVLTSLSLHCFWLELVSKIWVKSPQGQGSTIKSLNYIYPLWQNTCVWAVAPGYCFRYQLGTFLKKGCKLLCRYLLADPERSLPKPKLAASSQCLLTCHA